jgi:glycosyltransferase involved in cell wall biosynthesis
METLSSELMRLKRENENPQAINQQSAMTPLISVVIPCYNQAHYLGEAIESALNQDYPQVETLVVNDGSTDETAEVAARYSGVRCISQRNRGLSAARNTGLRGSRGAGVVFLDADDRLLPGALTAGWQCLQAHPECGFVYGAYRYIRDDGSVFLTPQIRTVSEHYPAMLTCNYIGMVAAAMYRREVFEVVGDFDERLKASEDYDLYLRIVRRFPICFHPELVSEYRCHPDSMSGDAALMLKSTLAVLAREKGFVRRRADYREAYREGVRAWQEYYGTRLINQIRTRIRERKPWRRTAGEAAILLRYYPHGFFTHVWRKLYCSVFRVESDYETSTSL